MTGLLGRTFGGYELAAQLRSDGIAQVFRAKPRSAGREVVVKVIYPEFAQQPGFSSRFEAIVAAASRLSHPHILPLVGSGEQNGYRYLITPFVAGGTLRDWLAEGKRLGAHDVAPFFRQVCEAASYAHSQGVIHGNIKPANMFLHEGRHLLLGDFGRLWDVTQIDLAHAGSGIEAVEYLAPEAIEAPPDQRSDIYSLGAVLYAGLTGHPPFRGQTPREIFMQHARATIPRLANAAPPVAPEVVALDEVIATAMAKAPDARYPSALKLAQAIEARVQVAGTRAASKNPLTPPGAVTPPGPVSMPSGLGLAHPPLPLPNQPGAPPLPFGAGAGRPVLGGTPMQSSFEPLPPTLEVEPEMEVGRAEALGHGVGALGELAKLPTTALPGQPGSPPLMMPMMPAIAPVESPTGRVPAPRIGMHHASPTSVPPPFAPQPPGSGGAAAPSNFDPAALPTIQMSTATPLASGPRWTPFLPTPAGTPGSVFPGAAGAPGYPNGGAPSASPSPSAVQYPGGAMPLVRTAPDSALWSPGAQPRTDSMVNSPNMPGGPTGTGAGTTDDWFGLDPDGQDAGGNRAAAAVGIAPGDALYSATRLGLPRLSTPELGGAAPSWRETVSEPSTPGVALGARSGERDALAASGQWTGESARWAESSQGDSGSGYWTESGDWISEPGRRTPAPGRSELRPGASTEHSRWAESRSRTDQRAYAASSTAFSVSSGAYSAYDTPTADAYWEDEAYTPRSVRTRRVRDDDSEYDRALSGQGRAHPYDDTNFDGSSAYLPLPVARRGTRARRAVASQALERAPSRRIAPILVLVVLLLLGSGVAVVAARPDLCPQNRCMAAHAALLHGLARLGIGAPATGTPPALRATPARVTLQAAAGGSASATLAVAAATANTGNWTASSSLSWLSVTPSSGTLTPGGSAQITLKASPGGLLAPQTYTTTVQVAYGGATLTIPVTITVAAAK